jgi:hypothetical protein
MMNRSGVAQATVCAGNMIGLKWLVPVELAKRL